MIFVCVYLRFKQQLHIIGRKLALLSLNTVQTLCVPLSQPKIMKIRKNRKIMIKKYECFAMRVPSEKGAEQTII